MGVGERQCARPESPIHRPNPPSIMVNYNPNSKRFLRMGLLALTEMALSEAPNRGPVCSTFLRVGLWTWADWSGSS